MSAIFGTWDDIPATGFRDEITDLWHRLAAQHVGTPQQQNNSGLSQRRGEITMLWELYRRARPMTVVEIGVAQGGTFAGWCILGRPDAMLIGIDRDTNDCRPRPNDPVHPLVSNNLSARCTRDGGGMFRLGRNNQRVVPINGWSHEPSVMEQLLEALGGKNIDFLFNDGSHSAEMATRDFELYWPLIAPGGIYASHDIMPSAVPECNKSVWWESTKARDDYSMRMEFCSSRASDSMGIGVLIKSFV